ncbi:MAG: response regulator [Betaproteobacteria bacterium]|nr:response regulator [Betaproteobacteria bacterium]
MAKRILIVEDQADLRKLVRMTLEYGDVEIEEAGDGASGLLKARELRPDIVLLDVMMPGELDGYQVCERIKRDESLSGVKVVLLTARGQRTDLEHGERVGCDAYLVKPFSPFELIATVDELTAPPL